MSEVLQLTWEDVDLTILTIRLWTRKRKGGGLEPRTLKMPKMMLRVIQRRYDNRDDRNPYVFHQPGGKPWTKDNKWVRGMTGRLCKKAKVKKFTFHALRHRRATSLEDSGEATLGMIQGFLGHKRKSTTEDYLKTLDRDAWDVVDIIDAEDERDNPLEAKKTPK